MKSFIFSLLFIVDMATITSYAYLESSKVLVLSQRVQKPQNLNEIGYPFPVRNQQKIVQKFNDSLWGVDYLKDYASITNFNVQKTVPTNSGNAYGIENNPMVHGTVKGNVNLFRHLLPQVKALDVTAHNALQFSVINNQEVEIILVPQASISWDNRYKFTIPANSSMASYDIAFTDFINTSGASFTHDDIKTIVFSILSDYKNVIPFSIALSDVRFGNYQPTLSVDDSTFENLTISNAPNPFNDLTMFQLPVASSFVDITVYDMSGRTVDKRTIQSINAGLQFEYHSPDLRNGMYHYGIITEQGKRFTGKFIIK